MNKAVKTDELTSHELEVDFVLSTIAKCLRTEDHVRDSKALQVYRKLSPEAIADLKAKKYQVIDLVVKNEEGEVLADNQAGAYHQVSWE